MSERIHPEERFVYYGDVCNRCGAETSDADIWQVLCPRCQQLAALEAEIGRAVIDAGVIFHSINPAIDELIARWRKLHAEGAEAEAATERQEEK